MKTFKDLEFKDHEAKPYFNTQAVMSFNNDYGISVVNGRFAYCDRDTYEVAVLYKGELTYNTDITDDVLRSQTQEDIDKLMKQIQEL